jgi:8-oxo-dGTP diphosphatase
MSANKPVTPLLCVDCVYFTQAGVVLIRRKNPPFEGQLALPGGFVDVGETVEDACRREMQEETNLVVQDLALVGVYSNPLRDARGHTVSIAFAAKGEAEGIAAGDDASEAILVGNWREKLLAFDHAQILADAEQKIQLN